jgi:hypothetical protein
MKCTGKYSHKSRAFKVPSQRSTFANVYINDIRYSLYWIGEEVDFDFIKSRYDDPNGNLYQGRAVRASLEYKGTDPFYYKNLTHTNGRLTAKVYDQKFGDGSYIDLVRLVSVLNISSEIEFERTLPMIFDVSRFLKNMAIEAVTCTTDTYTHGYHNYYLYYNPKTKLFEYIPYDYTFGYERKAMRNKRYKDWPDTSVLNWGYERYTDESPKYTWLTGRILKIENYKKMFVEYIRNFITKIFNPRSVLISRIKGYKNLLMSSVRNQYYNNIYMDQINHHRNNRVLKSDETFSFMLDKIIEFVENRYYNVSQQINNFYKN